MPFLPKRILVGTDFSEGSHQAADAAVSLAKLTGASVTLVHAIPLGTYVDLADASLRSHRELNEMVGERVKSQLAAEVSRIRWDGGDVQSLTVDGPAAQEMARVAGERQCDLVVVGSHGRTGLQRVLMGSVAEGTVRHSPASVLIIRTHSLHEQPGQM